MSELGLLEQLQARLDSVEQDRQADWSQPHHRGGGQDHVRRMQGQVKEHEGQPIGTVTKLDPSGFLESADGREIYFNRNSVLDPGFTHLSIGTRVSFAEEMGEKGPQASTVKLLGKHGLRA